MSLQVVALDRSDIPAYARVELEAFKSHPRTPMVWTKGYTPAVYAYNESGKQKGFGDPAEHSLKCFDTRTGQMVAGATYSFVFTEADGVVHAVGPPEPVKEDAPPPANWPEGGNWAITRFYKINTPKVIQQHLGGQPYILLDNLTVLPTYQGRGIGQRLLLWGIEQANRRNIRMCLESTPAGRRLYEQLGFREVTVIKANMHEFGWAEPYDESAAARVFMVREPGIQPPGLDWRVAF